MQYRKTHVESFRGAGVLGAWGQGVQFVHNGYSDCPGVAGGLGRGGRVEEQGSGA